MSHTTSRPNLRLVIPQRKDVDTDLNHDNNVNSLKGNSQGSLSPNLTPASPPTVPFPCESTVLKIGKYHLLSRTDTIQLQSGLSVDVYRASHLETGEECICKVVPANKYREVLSAYWVMGSHPHITDISEIIVGDTQAYVFFPRHHGDLHSFIRTKRKLREAEACRLFQQVAAAVAHCHANGVVLRDLKLRKFVFKDPERTMLKLESLEDACVLLDEDDDSLTDKHGCPAYVSPEILTTTERYSGKAADMWSLGVILYTMLIGRYPFQDSDAGALFTKIRRGMYTVPDTISSRARCLVRSLLRMDPHDRLSADEILQHPWFGLARKHGVGRSDTADKDQTVPDYVAQQLEFEFS